MTTRPTAIVTGAAPGIGATEAERLIESGVKVILNDIDADLVAETAERLGGAEVAVPVAGDISKPETAEALVHEATRDGQFLESVVNNAAVVRLGMIWEATDQDWADVFGPTLEGVFILSREAARYWRQRVLDTGEVRRASLFFTTSRAALLANPGQTPYAAAKAGVAAMGQTLARELRPYGVRSNVIAPRAYTRLMHSIGEWDLEALDDWDPGHVGRFVNYLCGPGGADITDFVRSRVKQKVNDPEVAEKLMPRDYPIGVRRPCFDTGYYESFNLPNVDLVDIKADPIERITKTGIKTRDGHYEVDLIILALGFESFTGSLDNMNIRNEHGTQPTDNWTRGPLTYLGLMTTDFPNLFNITGPGRPSVLTNFFIANPQQLDFIGDLIAHADRAGATRIEPTKEAELAWTQHSADIAEPLLRRKVDNYMTHVNPDDGTRVFISYAGGFGTYVAKCDEVAANGFEGFALS
ncbi:hypothetical protein BH09ACT10_BH09ACT10_28090 [soil metagenome]